MMNKQRFLILIFLAVLVVAFYPNEYTRIQSPDGQYTLIGKSFLIQSLMPGFPGQSGDKSGFLVLYDNVEDSTIGLAKIQMLNLMYDAEWREDQLSIKFVKDWQLPRKLNEDQY